MTDLSTIVATARDFEIKHPATGESLGLFLTLLPATHPKVQQASRRKLNARLHSREKVTAEQLDADAMDQIVAHISDWRWEGDLNFHGTKPEFSEKALRQVLTELPWIRAQVDRELADDAEFFRGTDQAAG